MNQVRSVQHTALRDLAALFFKLGVIGFGGPAVHTELMRREVVLKRGWMSEAHFLDLIGATNLIPGPNSTELAMHIGHERAGRIGLLVAGSCFILPAVFITGTIAWIYQQYGQLPVVRPFIYGIQPAVLAVIVSLMIGLSKTALKNMQLALLGILAAIAVLIGVNEIYVLFGTGILGVLLFLIKRKRNSVNSFVPFIFLQATSFSINGSTSQRSTLQLFWIFLKIGSILYGSGYVLFAFLKVELLSRGLLNERQLTDAIAVGQFTPGPVFSSATFVGWQIGGISGAIAATIGIFLPSFVLVALLNPIIPKLRKSAVMAAFLDTVNVASIAIVIAIVVEIGKVAVTDWRSILISLISFVVTFSYRKLNTAFVIFGGASLGYLLALIK
jgi:chromate transporter